MLGLDPRNHADTPLLEPCGSARKPSFSTGCRVKPDNGGDSGIFVVSTMPPLRLHKKMAGECPAISVFRSATDRSFADHLPGILSLMPLTYQFMLRIWLGSRWSPPLHSTVLPS